jgi:long-chain acyl-CoA synthetase
MSITEGDRMTYNSATPTTPTTSTAGQGSRAELQARALQAAANGMAVALWAKLIPERAAVITDAGQLSFRELNARANRLVRVLRSAGLKSGDGVALLSSNRPEYAEVFAAIRRAGLRLTTINWHLTAEEAAYIVVDCDAQAFIAEARFAAIALAAAKQAPRLQVRLAIGGAIEGFGDYQAALIRESADDVDDPQLGTTMLYTSGTTGRPKGVQRVGVVPNSLATLGFSDNYHPGQSVHLCTGPLYHAAPLSFSLGIPHMYGATVVMMDGWDAELALKLIQQHRVTHTHMVPTMFHRWLSLPRGVRDRYDVSSLQFVLHGAAPCPVSVKQRLIEWLGPVVYEYYAATEGTGCGVDSHAWLEKPGTVGKPVSAGHIKILDDAGQELPPTAIGTVYLAAPEVGKFNYYKDTDKTTRAYRDTHYTMGDVGYLDADGYLFLTDRSAHLIISGGVNIYPAEIEAVLIAHPGVADVGVIGIPNDEWGEEVKAVVELQPGYAASPNLSEELIEFCRARLAHFKCPRSVDFLPGLPRHDNGKLYKQALRAMYRNK